MLQLPKPFLKFKPNRASLLITYKLMVDVIFLALLFFIFALIVDAVLPGLISEKISFFRIILAISILLISIRYVSKVAGIEHMNNPGRSKSLYLLLAIFILLAVNSFLRLQISLVIVFIIIIALTSYFTWKSILEE